MAEKDLLLGAHMSTAGGFDKAIIRAESIGCTTMQIFTKSNRMWAAKKISLKEANLFKAELKKSNLHKIVAHAAYLINLASANHDTVKKSIKSLHNELERCEELGIHYLVLHPGSHGGQGVEVGINQIAEHLDTILNESGSTKILLETAAAQGTSIGDTFEQLKQIYSKSKHKKRLGICIDTCHIFSAGYDIRTKEEYEKTIKQFDSIIGLEHLHAIHLNDSKNGLGAKLDRHEKIGKGKLGLDAFRFIVNDKRLRNIPMILETPYVKSYEEYTQELEILKKLAH